MQTNKFLALCFCTFFFASIASVCFAQTSGTPTSGSSSNAIGVSNPISFKPVSESVNLNKPIVTTSVVTTEVVLPDGNKLVTMQTITTTTLKINKKDVVIEEKVVTESKVSDGTVTKSESLKKYSYDNRANLIGATGTKTSTTTSADKSVSTSTTTDTYTIINGKALVVKSNTQTTSVNADGSKETSTTITDYSGCYDSGGSLIKAPIGIRDVTGSTPEYTDMAGVKHAASSYTGHYNMTYAIIGGSAYVKQMSGSTITKHWDARTNTYVEDNTTTSTVTYNYIQINGAVLTKSTNAVSTTTQVTADAAGNHYTSSSNITTTYTYDQTTGALVGASGTGTGSGYLLTGAGNQLYTSTIRVTYAIKNKIAVQTAYSEVRTWQLPSKP